MENNLKKVLSNIEKIFLILIILAQVGLVLAVSYSLAYNTGGWNFSGLLFYFPGLLFSIGGLISGLIFFLRRKFNFILVVLLLTSIFSTPLIGYSISQSLVPLFKPIAVVNQQNDFNNQLASFKEAEQSLFNKLSAEFQNPQKVISVDSKYLVLVLENGDLVQLYGVSNQYKASDKESIDFIAWAQKNLIGKEITIKLSQQSLISCSVGTSSTVTKIREQNNLPLDKGGICSFIQAYVYADGQSLNEKFFNIK